MTVIRVFEIDGTCSYIVNGMNELLERVKTLIKGYNGNGDENFQLYVQDEQKDDYLLIKVSKIKNQ